MCRRSDLISSGGCDIPSALHVRRRRPWLLLRLRVGWAGRSQRTENRGSKTSKSIGMRAPDGRLKLAQGPLRAQLRPTGELPNLAQAAPMLMPMLMLMFDGRRPHSLPTPPAFELSQSELPASRRGRAESCAQRATTVFGRPNCQPTLPKPPTTSSQSARATHTQ